MQVRERLVVKLRAVEYSLDIESDLETRLSLTLSRDDEALSCSHSAAFLEALTLKTGNFKRFAVFVEMLVRAASQAEPSCLSLDLATMSGNKYLILVYTVQYDRVYYPVPLVPHAMLTL